MNDGICTCVFDTGYTCDCYNKKPSNYDRLKAAFINIRDYKTDTFGDPTTCMEEYMMNVDNVLKEIKDLL